MLVSDIFVLDKEQTSEADYRTKNPALYNWNLIAIQTNGIGEELFILPALL